MHRNFLPYQFQLFSEKKRRRRLHEDEREIYPNGELSKAEEYKENLIKNLLPETGMTICVWGGGEMQYHRQRKFKYNRKWCWMSTGRWNDFLRAHGKLVYGYLNDGSYLVLEPNRHFTLLHSDTGIVYFVNKYQQTK